MTVLLTTHYLEEAEELCDHIAIINHGTLILSEEKEALLSRIDGKEIRFRLDREIDVIPQVDGCSCVEKEGRRTLMVRYSPKEQAIGGVIETIQKAGYGIADISTSESDLEDVFIQLTR